TGKLLHQMTGSTGGIGAISISPDSRYILSSGDAVRLWDAQTGNKLQEIPLDALVAFLPDAQYFVTGGSEKIILWNIKTGKEIRRFAVIGSLDSITFSPDGKTLATGGEDKAIRLWDMQTGTEIRDFMGHTAAIGPIVFSPDGSILVSG